MPIEIVEHYYQMIQHLDNADKMALVEKINQSIADDYSKYPKLSRLKSRPNVVIGNSDDLVNISWEKELNLDFSS
ncbi:Uncharacterised protein [Moraxella caprae]|uniref:Uncharacterized protein n=2 Tax=Moraxella TaxID=475 RepID=A0A378R1N2_9GAMM|nr:hypothetical protein [Moraxella caprae]STZ09125.1 Uncharacterised protein [Moraxella caprae]